MKVIIDQIIDPIRDKNLLNMTLKWKKHSIERFSFDLIVSIRTLIKNNNCVYNVKTPTFKC